MEIHNYTVVCASSDVLSWVGPRILGLSQALVSMNESAEIPSLTRAQLVSWAGKKLWHLVKKMPELSKSAYEGRGDKDITRTSLRQYILHNLSLCIYLLIQQYHLISW
jgi:hypothetical protein